MRTGYEGLGTCGGAGFGRGVSPRVRLRVGRRGLRRHGPGRHGSHRRLLGSGSRLRGNGGLLLGGGGFLARGSCCLGRGDCPGQCAPEVIETNRMYKNLNFILIYGIIKHIIFLIVKGQFKFSLL